MHPNQILKRTFLKICKLKTQTKKDSEDTSDERQNYCTLWYQTQVWLNEGNAVADDDRNGNTNCDNDDDDEGKGFRPICCMNPKPLIQHELNDLVRDLNLPKKATQLLESRLQENNLLDPDTTFAWYRFLE